MARFQVMVGGTNLLLDMEDRADFGVFGFLATRIVSAPDKARAEQRAIEQVQSELAAGGMLKNPPDDPPRYFVEESVQLNLLALFVQNPGGFTFFPDGDDEEDDDA